MLKDGENTYIERENIKINSKKLQDIKSMNKNTK